MVGGGSCGESSSCGAYDGRAQSQQGFNTQEGTADLIQSNRLLGHINQRLVERKSAHTWKLFAKLSEPRAKQAPHILHLVRSHVAIAPPLAIFAHVLIRRGRALSAAARRERAHEQPEALGVAWALVEWSGRESPECRALIRMDQRRVIARAAPLAEHRALACGAELHADVGEADSAAGEEAAVIGYECKG